MFWVIFLSSCLAFSGTLLEPFWRPFLAKNGVNQLPFFLKGSWWLPGAVLGALLAVLGLSWEAWCSKNTLETNTKHIFKIVSFRCLSYLKRLLEAILAHFGDFGEKKVGPQNEYKSVPKRVPLCFAFLVKFLANFGIHFGVRIGSTRILKMKPDLGFRGRTQVFGRKASSVSEGYFGRCREGEGVILLSNTHQPPIAQSTS